MVVFIFSYAALVGICWIGRPIFLVLDEPDFVVVHLPDLVGPLSEGALLHVGVPEQEDAGSQDEPGLVDQKEEPFEITDCNPVMRGRVEPKTVLHEEVEGVGEIEDEVRGNHGDDGGEGGVLPLLRHAAPQASQRYQWVNAEQACLE